FLSGGADGFVRRWNATSGEQVREFDNGAAVVALAIRPDARRIASAGPDFVKLWAEDAAKPVAQLQGDPRLAAKIPRLDGEIALTKAVVMRTKQDLKSYEGLERAVTVVGEALKKAEAELAQAQKMRDDNQRLAVGCDDAVLHLHDAETGLPSESLANHRDAIRALAFTSTGLLVSSSLDRRAVVWDASNRWRLERTIGGTQNPGLFVDR